jgi:O-antigen/teichoic acid export membrane protein
VTGVFIYFFILGTLDAVLTLSPNYESIAVAVPIFAVIGLSKLIEMGASVNHYILMYSPKYRSVLVFVILMAVTNIVLNYYLITNMYILGAAISTCVTTYLYQLVKCFYIEKEYGIHPFTKMTTRIMLLFVIAMAYFAFLPRMAPPILQAMIYSAGLVIIYYGGIRLLGIRSDATDAAEKHLSTLMARLRSKR